MEYPKFKVCVKCITYNQAKYIEDSMNGFTIQQTDFPFVCCIIDDASTDGEQEVIRSYLKAHFEMGDSSVAFEKETDYANIIYAQHKNNKNCYFAVLLLKKNLFKYGDLKLKYISEWRDLCEYEALCEGDDYWIEPKKLQMQVDFLDKNQDYGLCYTRCIYYKQKTHKIEKKWGGPSTDFKDLLIECTIPTLSVLMRLGKLKQFEIEGHLKNNQWLMGDYPMWLWFAHETKIQFMDKVTCVYRVLENSASHSNKLEIFEKFIYSTYDMLTYFCSLYKCQSLLQKDWLPVHLFSTAVMYGDKEKAELYYKKIISPNWIQKIKYNICKHHILYKLFASYLFYTK